MTGCSAKNCTNRSEKGHRMYVFPSNPERRKIWADKVNRAGWQPTSQSGLCQEHFEHDQFENRRADGKIKLRWNAIPTIFSEQSSQQKAPKRKRYTTVQSSPKKIKKEFDHTYNEGQQNDEASNKIQQNEDSNKMQQSYEASNKIQQNDEASNKIQQNDEASSASETEDYCHEDEALDENVQAEAEDSFPEDKVSDVENNIIKELKSQLKAAKRQNKCLLQAKGKQEGRISKLFTPDQLKALTSVNMTGVPWSAATVKKALKLRLACGISGYNILLKEHYPLPSEQTLQRRLQNIAFQPGILFNVFQMLEIKINGMDENEKLCSLTLDEMALSAGIEYDVSSGNLLGNVTLHEHVGRADHALVFTLKGIITQWKQTVAYHYTSLHSDGAVFKNIILGIIHHAASIGLHVEAVTCAMSDSNRAMWKSFGVICGTYCETVNKIPHPEAPEKWLYFLADVPHMYKKVKSALIKGMAFTLSDETVSEYQLQSNFVSVEPLMDLAKFQENLDMKIAPQLTVSSLTPNQFDKMKVSSATRVMSHDVSCGVKYLVEREGRKEENLTTSWFIDTLNHWFQLMTSRHPVLALCRADVKKYEESVKFLKEVIDIFRNLKIGKRRDWKPIQIEVIISTASVLEIADDLLNADYKYLLTSRLSKDCLENLISLVQIRKPRLSTLDFKYALKTISIAQLLALPNSGCYEKDDAELLGDFMENDVKSSCCLKGINNIEFTKNSDDDLSTSERDSLYNFIGYCLLKIKLKEATCDKCLREFVQFPDHEFHETSNLASGKEHKKGSLPAISEKAYDIVFKVEMMFRKNQDDLLRKTNVRKFLIDEAIDILKDFKIPSCHNIKYKLINMFLNARLHFYCKRVNDDLKKSQHKKSVAMRSLGLVKNIKEDI